MHNSILGFAGPHILDFPSPRSGFIERLTGGLTSEKGATFYRMGQQTIYDYYKKINGRFIYLFRDSRAVKSVRVSVLEEKVLRIKMINAFLARFQPREYAYWEDRPHTYSPIEFPEKFQVKVKVYKIIEAARSPESQIHLRVKAESERDNHFFHIVHGVNTKLVDMKQSYYIGPVDEEFSALSGRTIKPRLESPGFSSIKNTLEEMIYTKELLIEITD